MRVPQIGREYFPYKAVTEKLTQKLIYKDFSDKYSFFETSFFSNCVFNLKGSHANYVINKIIASTKITNTEIFAFIALLVFKVGLSPPQKNSFHLLQ